MGQVELFQNYPNPFNPTTTVSFYLPRPGRAVLTVFDVQGRHLRALLDEALDFGMHEILWDGTDDRGNHVSSGIYFYRLASGGKVITKKLTVMK